MARQPTFFVTSFHPLISRNILMAGVHRKLAEDARVVLLVPELKQAYFESEYGGKNIVVEGIDTTLSWRDTFLRKLALALTNTRGLAIKKRAEYFADGKLISYLAAIVPAKIVGGSRLGAALLSLLSRALTPRGTFKRFFETYRPSLVFSTDVQNEFDVRLLTEARARRVSTVGMVRSWDNISSKGLLRALPDRLLVHNALLREELIVRNFVSPARIAVVGIPHYDRYADGPTKTREAFFAQFGFSLEKPLILFAPIGDRYVRDNRLDRLVLSELSTLDANILVRLPPTDRVTLEGFESRGARVVFDETGNSPWKGKRGASKLSELSREDEEHLVNSLAHADVLVTGHSTIAVDASVFDLPTVVVAFDSEPRAYFDSMRRYYDYDYYLPIKESGGVAFVEEHGELVPAVEAYLKDPALGREGRARIKELEAGPLDGRATDRLVGELEGFLEA